MVLVHKWSFFKLFFLGNIAQENLFHNILERKNAFLGYENKKFKKSKNSHFSKGVKPLFLSKNGHLSNFFFRQYRPGKYLLRYSRTKKRFFKLLKQEVQKSKNSHFSKGVNPWFLVQKWPFFQLFFFRQYGPGKCL